MSRNPIFDVEIVIFDMDGVLIDVSKSYRETIKKAVAIYLRRALGIKGDEKSLVSDDDIVCDHQSSLLLRHPVGRGRTRGFPYDTFNG
jgi:phosphoglycolate phosphatase-like HAD superfamily hydrolase